EDLYVIVNIHHEDWIDRGDLGTAYDDASTQLPIQFRAVWTQIADEFAGYDQHLVFEDMNEPHAPYIDSSGEENWGYATAGTVSTVNRLNADFVSLMRGFSDAGHRERLLMMPHDTDGGELSNTGFVLPSDPYNRIALSYHCYTPHSWTHYLFKKDLSVTGEDNVYTDTYRSDVETTWNGYRTQLTKYGCPIVLGEFGCYYCTESRQQDRLDWMAQYATHAKELGIPMFYWRMDRTVEQDGVEKVIWSAFDEVQQRISPLSSDMIAKWFEILNGDDIVWGENAIVEDGEHASLESAEGVQPTGRGRAATLPQTVKSPLATSDDEQQRILFNCTLAAIDGKEVAVKFTGNAPRLQVIGSNWKGGWWGISADTVDYRNGIAYYKDTSVRTYWQSQLANNGEVSGLTMDDVAYIGLRTADSGSQTATDAQLSTTVERVALVHRHEWGGWTHDMAASGDASVTDRRVCAHDASHVLVRTVGDFTSWQALEPATCTNGGIETRSYKAFPSYMQQRATAALGHSWNAGTVTVAPTATEPGVRTFTCTRCGEVRTEPIPATGETGEPRQGSEEASQPTPPEEPAVTSLAGAAVMLTATRFTYDGKAKAPAVKSVTLGAKTLSGNGDFTVSYSPGRTNAGTYTVSVRGTGAYEGVATATFTIEP
ncbi:MAG: cellulase family glycosylhydrolase, partial [Eggerthellaceae bacterium]|nr:cellulase family glycosylhydrolase [Eggerthellaceae bacterium]